MKAKNVDLRNEPLKACGRLKVLTVQEHPLFGSQSDTKSVERVVEDLRKVSPIK